VLRRSLLILVVCSIGSSAIGITGCNFWGSARRDPIPEEDAAVEGGFALKNLILKQTDQKGKLTWQLKAKSAEYGESRKQVRVRGLSGTLFQQGKPAYTVTASAALLRQQKDDLLLQGKVIITDLGSKGVFTAQKFEWQPGKQQLIAQKEVKLTHPMVVITAKEMRASSQTNQVIAQGTVIANSAPKRLRLLTERLIWQPTQQQIFAGGLSTEKYTGVLVLRSPQPGKGDPKTPDPAKSDRAQGGSLQVNLKTETLTLKEPAQLRLADPALEVESQELVWEIKQGGLTSPKNLKIRSITKGITLVADRGSVDQPAKKVLVSGNVKVIGQKNAAFLTTDQLIWNLPTQQVEALGNVFYRQQNPQFTLRGARAIGLIREQKIVVTGGNVVTQIFPE
jgi:LPS export ABC transporter protein LptC